MNSLYLENSTMGSLFRFFSRYFSAATRPTQFLLTWLVIAQLTLQSFPSLRFLHRNFLSSVTHCCLNSYYRALRNETVTSRSLRLQTAALACSLIPAALQNEPVFLSVDDTTVPKFGKKFDAVSLLHDHACHTGKPYVNGHCFVSLTLSVPVLSPREGNAPLIRYLAIPVGYRMWTKERTKLELAGDLVEEMMPLLKGRQVLLFFDSWYAKSSLMERVLQYPQLAIVCNVRSDSAMYELPPLPNGKPGRPKKRGKRIHLDDFTLSWEMDGMRIGHRLVLTNICGNRRIHAYVSCTTSGSRRLFFSTLDPNDLHMSCAWQERKTLRDASADGIEYYPLKLYKLRWAIETNYYEQKTFWSLNAYRIRRQTGIEHMVNLVNLVHSSLKMLPYLDEHFAKYKNASPQELRSHLSWQIQREIFFDTLVSKAQTAKNSTDFVQALCKLASVTTEAA